MSELSQQLPKEHKIARRNLHRITEKDTNNNRERHSKTFRICLKDQVEKELKYMLSIWQQDNIYEQHDSSKVSVPSQAPNRIQHDQELCVFLPMQLR